MLTDTMTQKELMVTNRLLPNAALLLVGMKDVVVSNEIGIFNTKDIQTEVDLRLKRLCKVLSNFESIHPIYSFSEHTCYSQWRELNIQYLSDWKQEDDEWLIKLKSYPAVLVCGLWKEKEVLDMTLKLHSKGVNAVLLDNPLFTLESKLLGDFETLDRYVFENRMKLVRL